MRCLSQTVGGGSGGKVSAERHGSKGRAVRGPVQRGARFAGSEGGFAGGAEGLIFGFLFFVLGTLFIATAWGVLDTKLAASAAARQAARAYVRAPNAASAASRAQADADAALAGYGRDPASAVVRLSRGHFGRCQRVTIEVSYPSPLVYLPLLSRVGYAGEVSATHSELVAPFQSGPAGTASCA